MTSFSREDRSVLGRWWWTVDRWTLLALILLTATGAVLIMAASPGAANRIGLDPFHFVRNQFVFLAPALLVMIAVSLLTPTGVRRLAVIGFGLAVVLMVATLLVGVEAKGASRWINLGGFSLQPSEFIKPCFAVVAAWMFSHARLEPTFPGRLIACVLFGRRSPDFAA